MKISKTYIVTLSVLGTLTLLTLGLWIFLIMKSSSLKSESLAVESDILARTSEGAYFNSIRNVLKGSKPYLETIDSRFIDKDSVPQFIDLLETKSLEAGINSDFSSIDIGAQNGSEGLLRIRITGTGTWSNIISFIATLESLPYASKIESLSFAKPNIKESIWSFSLDFTENISEKK
ncbi:MAG: Pilus assembly protein PilO [Candidatus Parcubacteria bacterium]|jgi:hypothetical protein